MGYMNHNGRRLAFVKTEGQGPCVVFLGGFKSDMTGTKATALENWAKVRGQSFLRFDYSGHGASEGAFEDGAIGDWLDDARAVIAAQAGGDVVLVGSSMGGWISLLLAKEMGRTLRGLVTIAAAPDFTEDQMFAGFTDQEREMMDRTGRVEQPSDYDDGPYVITRRLIEDGRNHLILRTPLTLNCPARFLHGTEDKDVPVARGLALLEHADGDDLRLTLVKGADHRFSSPDAIGLMLATVEDVLKTAG